MDTPLGHNEYSVRTQRIVRCNSGKISVMIGGFWNEKEAITGFLSVLFCCSRFLWLILHTIEKNDAEKSLL